MKTIFNRFSAAFAALAVMAAVVFDLSAKTASAASCDIDHSNATQLTEEPEQLTGSSYYLGESIVLTKEIAIEGAVTLCLNGQTITAASGSRVFTIKNGGSLTICDCQNAGEITGGNVSSGNDENSDSYGGAIIIDNGGSLTLNGGKIAVCSAKRGGGVCVNGGTFTINAGTISQNTAEHQGGGVYVSGGTFTMNGGTILGNTVTGSGATDGGGGVYTAGTFTLNGGSKISDNKAESSFGGGVLVSGTNAEFTLQSGTISGNSANYGGGVHVSSSGKVTMNGGTIGGGNTASGGAGVCLGTGNGAFTMTNGTITGNTSNYGGGIQMNGGTMTFDGPVTIKDNHRKNGKDSNVYLRETGKDAPTCFTITIGANFNPTAPIGVHIQPAIECHKDVDTTQFAADVSAKDISGNFKNDDAGQEIVYKDNKVKLHVEHDYGEWTITKAPGINTTGTATRVCKKNKSHVETEVLPPLSDTDFWTKDPDKDEYTNESYGTTTPPSQNVPAATPTVGNDNNDNKTDNTPNLPDDKTIIYKDPPTGISLSLAPPALAIAAITALLIRRKK